MKQQLTITVDAELVQLAKQHARSRGVSLSALIEECLREVACAHPESFSSRWRGRFRAADRGGPRYDSLVEKYLQ